MFKEFDFKGENQIVDIDLTKNTVSGYLSAWAVVDSDQDMLMRGAFAKSIQERGPLSSGNRKIAFLRSHNTDRPVGRFTELEEDNKGLRYVAKMSQRADGRDTLIQLQEGLLTEHSIGYRRIWDEVQWSDQAQYNEVREVKLMEGSVLVFGANSETPISEIKSEDKVKMLADLSTRMDKVTRVISKGQGLTDETFTLLEIELTRIKSKYEALIKEPMKVTPKQDKPLTLYTISLT